MIDKFFSKVTCVILVAFAVCSAYLYHGLVLKWSSDIPSHMDAALDHTGYSLAHTIIRICYRLGDATSILIVVLTLANVVTALSIGFFVSGVLHESGLEVTPSVAILIGICGVVLSQVYIPGIYPHFYIHDTLLTQPWHNTTYVFMRLFGYLSLAIYFHIYKHYCEKGNWVRFFAFTVVLTLVNWSKPNFFLGFAPLMLVMLVIDFIKARGQILFYCIRFGSCVLLSMPILFWQFGKVYGNGDDSELVFSASELVTAFNTPFYFVVLMVNLIFPLFVTIAVFVRRKVIEESKISSSVLPQAWGMFIISYFQKMCMLETGSRQGHGNYAWGVYFFTAVLWVVALAELIKMRQKRILRSNSIYVGGLLLFGLSVLSGIGYGWSLATVHSYVY